MIISFQKKLLAGMIAVALTGCGGDNAAVGGTPGNSGSASNPTSSEADDTRALGEIDGFGSVIVNGVRYDTDTAIVTIDGELATERQLRVGEIVDIQGKIDAKGNGRASEVKMRTRLAGKVSSVDTENRTFMVMDYTVVITEDTQLGEGINEATLEGLEGNIANISGNKIEDSMFKATRVDVRVVKPGNEGAQPSNRLFGEVESLDAGAMTLVVDGKVIDYSNAILRNEDALAVGAKVIILGDLMEGTLVAERLYVASQAKPTTPTEPTDPKPTRPMRVQLAGVVEATEAGLSLGGETLVLSDNTRFSGGDAEDLVAGAKVVVSGVKSDEGVSVSFVRFDKPSTASVVGAVEAVDAEAMTLTISGETYNVEADTDFIDRSSVQNRMFAFGDIVEGDMLALRAVVAGELRVAKSIIKLDAMMPMTKRGQFVATIASVAENMLITTAGVTVNITEKTRLEGFELDDLALGRGGDKLIISGVYTAEKVLNAVVIRGAGPKQPERPTNPQKPTNPERPTNPQKPTKPERPTNPQKPTKPERPTNPQKPTNPERPTKPSEPKGGGKNCRKGNLSGGLPGQPVEFCE